MTELLQTLSLGLLLGGVYALAASGLTLIFGVMRVINIAHGAFLVLASFITYTLWDVAGIDPLLAILITTPVVLPVLHALDINAVWYGILLMINLELALITPPVGMNLFVIKGIVQAPMWPIIRGVLPYVVLMWIGLLGVLAWPDLALWLPATMALGR